MCFCSFFFFFYSKLCPYLQYNVMYIATSYGKARIYWLETHTTITMYYIILYSGGTTPPSRLSASAVYIIGALSSFRRLTKGSVRPSPSAPIQPFRRPPGVLTLFYISGSQSAFRVRVHSKSTSLRKLFYSILYGKKSFVAYIIHWNRQY